MKRRDNRHPAVFVAKWPSVIVLVVVVAMALTIVWAWSGGPDQGDLPGGLLIGVLTFARPVAGPATMVSSLMVAY
jgi:hypothetical protein